MNLIPGELFVLLIFLGVFALFLVKKDEIEKIKYWEYLIASFTFFLFSQVFTNIEVVYPYFNLIEHFSLFLGSSFLLIWTYLFTRRDVG